MAKVRIAARLDIKGPNLIKGVHLEGLRVVGDPHEFARRYYEANIDELIYMDIVASLYGRNNLTDVVRRTVRDIFIPITVGGGIRSLDDAREILRSGADKVAINTQATKTPELIRDMSRRFGSQCMVLNIEAKRQSEGSWEVYTDNGRERTGMSVVEWAKQGEELGAGEILLTSVDQEGTRQGFDIPLIKAVTDVVSIPVVASGGMGKSEHFYQAVEEGRASSVAMADILHYNRMEVGEVRRQALAHGIDVRSL